MESFENGNLIFKSFYKERKKIWVLFEAKNKNNIYMAFSIVLYA
jgi:hypothetical protein